VVEQNVVVDANTVRRVDSFRAERDAYRGHVIECARQYADGGIDI
jgi:hypothetical protein